MEKKIGRRERSPISKEEMRRYGPGFSHSGMRTGSIEAVPGKKVILLEDDAACSLDFVVKFWDLAMKCDTPEFLKRGPLADEYSRVLHLSPVSAMKALRDCKHRDELWPGQAEARSDLLSLLKISRINLASDSTDNVYSLLSLAERDSIADSITPGYSEKIPPQ